MPQGKGKKLKFQKRGRCVVCEGAGIRVGRNLVIYSNLLYLGAYNFDPYPTLSAVSMTCAVSRCQEAEGPLSDELSGH